MSYDFETIDETIIKEGLHLDQLKMILHILCDEDFNGSNGEDYFIPATENGVKVLKSRLDVSWEAALKKYPKDNFAAIIEYVLNDAYSYDTEYYRGYSVNVIDTTDKIFVIVSYMSYV